MVEVRFKTAEKDFLPDDLTVSVGDPVITEVDNGYDLGLVTLTGELVRFQMKKKNITQDSEEVSKLLRKANQQEIDKWHFLRDKEPEIQNERESLGLGLEMKLSDVEFQGDEKATFYYTANSRVDFRQLIKDMAQAFSIRIEMRQIGLRQEAARLGGIVLGGRVVLLHLVDDTVQFYLGCRYQQLSLNPLKLVVNVANSSVV